MKAIRFFGGPNDGQRLDVEDITTITFLLLVEPVPEIEEWDLLHPPVYEYAVDRRTPHELGLLDTVFAHPMDWRCRKWGWWLSKNQMDASPDAPWHQLMVYHTIRKRTTDLAKMGEMVANPRNQWWQVQLVESNEFWQEKDVAVLLTNWCYTCPGTTETPFQRWERTLREQQ